MPFFYRITVCVFKCTEHVPLIGPRFSDQRFPGEFPHQGGPLSDYPVGEYGEPGFGGYSSSQDFLDSGMNQRPFPDGMGPRPFPDGMGHRPAEDGFGPGGGRDGYGRSGLLKESPGRMYPDEYRGSQMGSNLMDKPLERPGLMGAAPESSSLPNTLLTYLVCLISHNRFLPNLKVPVLFCSYSNFSKCIFRILSG